MNKTIKYALVVIVLLMTIGFGTVNAKKYYNDRYVGSTYYGKIPTTMSMEPKMLYGDKNREMGYGKEYNIKVYNESGNERIAEFEVISDNPEEYYKPGTYLKVEMSKQIVVKQKPISKEDIPENILKLIEESN